MEHYVGLDVSLKLTAICIVDQTGEGLAHERPPYYSICSDCWCLRRRGVRFLAAAEGRGFEPRRLAG